VWRGSGGMLWRYWGQEGMWACRARWSIDELLDRAVAAINRGDRVTATALAGQVLAVDQKNADAEDCWAPLAMLVKSAG